jgi:hypothetical protein
MSRAMTACLIRVIRLGRVLYPTQTGEWLFPADSVSGHLAEHKEDRSILANWGNALRQTYRTVGQAAGIADLDIRLLMNHSVRSVNAGYITRSKPLTDHLRQQQETISRKMVDAARSKTGSVNGVSAEWPFLPSRRVINDVLQASEVTNNANNTRSSAVRQSMEIRQYLARMSPDFVRIAHTDPA